MATMRTRRENDGTYSFKVIASDGYGAKGPWSRTQALTPWGARVQGAEYLKMENDAEAWMEAEERKPKGHTHGGYGTGDFANMCESCNA